MATQQEVYTGLWTNHARGTSLLGATLTLTSRDGAYLIAFLALFVHITGACFWRLISYGIFQTRAHPGLQDQAKLQEQIVLRNSPTSISALRNLFFILIRSRGDLRNSNLALICIAAINLTTFLMAGILSSKVMGTSSNVLLNPTHCGRFWTYDFASVYGTPSHYEVHEAQYYWSQFAANQLRQSSNQYAAICYGSESGNPPEACSSFGPRAPTWNKSLQPGCPFKDGMCDGNMTLYIDSGYIDSTLDLGINTPPQDRLSLRLVKECAPLISAAYMDIYDGSNITDILVKNYIPGSISSHLPVPLDEVAVEGLGPDWRDNSYEAFFYGQSYENTFTNATFIYANTTVQELPLMQGFTPPLLLYKDAYQQCRNEFPGMPLAFTSPHCPSSFEPIQSLKVDGHNIVLLYLASRVLFLSPVTDPWFLTDVKNQEWVNKSFAIDYYTREHSTTALACAEKTELCKSRDSPNGQPTCVQLNSHGWHHGSPMDAPANITQLLGLTRRQTAVAHRLQDASFIGDFGQTVTGLGAASMLAWTEILNNKGAHLPDNQWAQELEHWFATQLITMQSYSMEFVTGCQDRNLNQFVTPPPEADMWMCESQVIQRKDYASFSVLGICIILVVGGSIVLVNMCITRLVNRVRPRTPLQMYKKGSWKANDLLELQAMAAEPIHRKAESYVLPGTHLEKTPTETSLEMPKGVTT